MKKIKLLLVMAVLTSLCFTSCDKDDGEDKPVEIVSENLIGTWNAVWQSGYYAAAGENDEWSEVPDGVMPMTFRAGGEGIVGVVGDGLNFSWELQGNRLSMIPVGESSVVSCTVVYLSERQLILEYFEKTTTMEYYEKISYERVR